jgi:hypothetical protein
MAVWGSTITAMFSSGSLLFTESMPQQVKESQKHGSAIFQRKDSDRYRQLFRFSSFFHAGSWQDLFGISLGGCHFIVTAFASILIGLYFIFMTTEKA